MTAQLSCHVQNVIATIYHNLDESSMKFPSNLNYDGKNVHEMGPWSVGTDYNNTLFQLDLNWYFKLFSEMGTYVTMVIANIHEERWLPCNDFSGTESFHPDHMYILWWQW